jgi:hypothetical protein
MSNSAPRAGISENVSSLWLERQWYRFLVLIALLLTAASFITVLVRVVSGLISWLRTGDSGSTLSAFDVLATVFGPKRWFTDPTDWIGVWNILNWLGGVGFLFWLGTGSLWAAIYFESLAETLEKKIKAKRARPDSRAHKEPY